MKLQDDESEPSSIDVTPLIDVVFLLLIFFMVSTTFSNESELEIQLPESSAEVKESQVENIEIAIDKEGQYFMDGHQLVNTEMVTVKKALLDLANGEKVPVVINADANTPHQAVITAMDAARQAGLTHLTFATVQTDTK